MEALGAVSIVINVQMLKRVKERKARELGDEEVEPGLMQIRATISPPLVALVASLISHHSVSPLQGRFPHSMSPSQSIANVYATSSGLVTIRFHISSTTFENPVLSCI